MDKNMAAVVREIIQDLRQEFERQEANESLPALREAIRRAGLQLDASTRLTFVPGMRVTFKPERLLVALTGKVMKVNVKSVSVRVSEPSTHAGQTWRVSPSLLSHAAPQEITPMPMEPSRASDIAREACAEERFGADECEARHLVEKDGTHLIFVETPAHGYFISVSDDGIARFVGEEDCGIPDARVRKFFGVGQYAEEQMNWIS
jgi:hypothetical protein